jgi:hypothetical protein
MNFGAMIINYELITNYPWLIIKLELAIKQKLFYNFISEIKFDFKLYNLNYNFIKFIQFPTIFRSLN